VADGVVEGAEIEATLIPTSHIEISGFYSYLNPFFTSNTVDGQNYVNSPIAETVKHKTSATVRYLFGLPDSIGDASVSATYSWQSTQTGGLFLGTSPTTDPLHGLLPSYGLLNLRADWKRVFGSSVDIGAFVENATNKTYLTLMNNAWTLGEDVGEYGPPRMFGLEARWHFGHD
jgi:iron complex outermembrane receptor protein